MASDGWCSSRAWLRGFRVIWSISARDKCSAVDGSTLLARFEQNEPHGIFKNCSIVIIRSHAGCAILIRRGWIISRITQPTHVIREEQAVIFPLLIGRAWLVENGAVPHRDVKRSECCHWTTMATIKIERLLLKHLYRHKLTTLEPFHEFWRRTMHRRDQLPVANKAEWQRCHSFQIYSASTFKYLRDTDIADNICLEFARFFIYYIRDSDYSEKNKSKNIQIFKKLTGLASLQTQSMAAYRFHQSLRWQFYVAHKAGGISGSGGDICFLKYMNISEHE